MASGCAGRCSRRERLCEAKSLTALPAAPPEWKRGHQIGTHFPAPKPKKANYTYGVHCDVGSALRTGMQSLTR